ncbi:hypothetical protein sos41_38540 [Alphaproteobacteria bacterium SO-S41]|nr:hypothetical protein sos41_38540 [Alphaproteobacteria bacterium SO-S41]
MKRLFVGGVLAAGLALSSLIHGQEAAPAPTNLTIETAETVKLDQRVETKIIISDGGYAVAAYYALEIPSEDEAARFDIVVANPTNARLNLTLADERDGSIAQADRAETGELRFKNFVLGKGRHFLRIGASLEKDDPVPPFTLSFERKGTWQTGEEREPNGDFKSESVVPVSVVMKGVIDDDNDRDFGAFEVTGPLQLWKLEARGPSANSLMLFNPQGSEIKRAERPSPSENPQLWSVLLPPGLAHVRVSGPPGAWEIVATPQGPAPIEVLGGDAAARKAGEIDEVEPNDGVDRALTLPLDGSRAGQIESSSDEDVYRFTLDAETHVRLSLTGPNDIRLRGNMYRVSTGWDAGWLQPVPPPVAEGAPPPTMVSMDTDYDLPQGDYYVELRADKPSAVPYVLSLKRLPIFGPETDLEPNDDIEGAQRVPASLRITGTMRKDDADWFRLPDLDKPATLTVTATVAPDDLRLRLGRLALERTASGPERWNVDDSDGDLTRSEDKKSFTIDLPAGKDRYLRVTSGGLGAYDLQIAFSDGPVAVPPSTELTATLAPAAKDVAAFAEVHQKLGVTLSVRNAGSAAVTAPLTFALSDDRWSIEGAPPTVAIAPGASVDVAVTLVAPPLLLDGTKIVVSAKAGDASVEATVGVTSAAAMASPERRWDLPESMLGGVNVAWRALGGTTTEPNKLLIDGYATSGTAERIDASDEPDYIAVLDLAGDAPLKIVGVTVNPTIGPDLPSQVKRLAIETSVDGTAYTRVFEGEIGPRQREYAIPFATPVEAKFVKVLPITAQGNNNAVPMIGEVKVIAEAATAATIAPGGFNVADPALGGFLTTFHPISSYAFKMIKPDTSTDAAYIGKDDKRQIDWTIAFRNQRAALLSSITWEDPTDLDPRTTIDRVEVETAMAADGPFTKAGTWEITRNGDGTTQPFTFPAGTWARFVRFNVVVPPYNEELHGNYFRMPKVLKILEAPWSAAAGSIVAEWGELTSDGPYERLNPRPLPQGIAALEAGGDTKETARVLPAGEVKPGRVAAGTRSEWWAIDVPAEGQSLVLTLAGRPALSVTAAMQDASGKAVSLVVSQDDGKTRIAASKVSPGRYYVKVEEPPRSIALVWDTSGSVGPYVPTIIQSIRGFSRSLTPGRDEVALLPFSDPKAVPILTDWTGDPLTAFAALNGYDWHDQSSNAEGGVVGAADALDGRPGTRAAILITDFATGSDYDQRMQSYDLIGKVRPRIFSFAIPSGSDADGAAEERGLMLQYTALSGGTATYAGTPGDLEKAFALTVAALRAPKDYTIAAEIGFKPPEPGHVQVTVPESAEAPPASKDRAVLVILDASGSMLKKLGKKRRIDIAKDTLNELTQTMLPEGTPLAMRVFGDTKPDSCETNLRLPLAPLDRAAAKGVVDKIVSINKAKTAIGASLALAADDLGGTAGQKLIILITDGEETCDGDPAAEIEALKAKGVDARISIVGFAVDDQALKDTFSAWAAAGGGGYFDATKPGDLAPAVRKALLPPFEVVAADGSVVATGVAGGEPVEAPPGTYTIRVLTDPVQEFPGIVIESGGMASVALGQ